MSLTTPLPKGPLGVEDAVATMGATVVAVRTTVTTEVTEEAGEGVATREGMALPVVEVGVDDDKQFSDYDQTPSNCSAVFQRYIDFLRSK